MNLQKGLVNSSGINALDLIGEKASGKDYAKAKALLEMNYGIEYQKEKFSMLFEMIAEEQWSSERFMRTVKWFLKNKKFPNWTIADWFEFGIKLYPYSWYQEQLSKGIKHEEMEAYRINGKILWKMKDENDLPLEKV